jgi:hypothetical protein
MKTLTLTEDEAAIVYNTLRTALTAAQERIEDAKHWADEFSDEEIAEENANAFLFDAVLTKLL